MAPPNNRNQNQPRRACPPPLVRSPRTGRCILPRRVVGRGPGGGSPFGGPGTSPFGGPATSPSGFGNPGPSPIIGPIPAPGPTPPPPPTCTTPTIFADCFETCTGTIDGASPGPVCGWTFIEPFGALGGEFNFTPGVMSMDTFDADDFPIATKPLPAPLASVFNTSLQFDFTEYATAPNLNTAYQVLINNVGLTETIFLSLFGDGSVAVQVGDPASAATYSGVWTPTPGADHVVHLTIDGAGVPLLYIDGILIPLAFLGNAGSFATAYPSDSVSYGGGAAVAAAAVSPLRSLFVTSGIFAPETDFCCPG